MDKATEITQAPCPECTIGTEHWTYTTPDHHRITRVHEGPEHLLGCRHFRAIREEDTPPTASSCRRCSECEGEDHHFMGPELVGDPEDENVGFICKHCDYTTAAVECAMCDELVPTDIVGDDNVCPTCRPPTLTLVRS